VLFKMDPVYKLGTRHCFVLILGKIRNTKSDHKYATDRIKCQLRMFVYRRTWIFRRKQQNSDMIISLGEGRWKGSNCISHDKVLVTQSITFPNLQVITSKPEALNFLFPSSFNTLNFTDRVIYSRTKQCSG